MNTIAAPPRSLAQRMEALKRANKVRTERADYKRDLKAGRESIIDALITPPEFLETAKVFDLLLAVPKYGRVKVNKVLQVARISPSKTFGGLTVRQRSELARMLPGTSPAVGIWDTAAAAAAAAAAQAENMDLTRFERAVLWHAGDLGDAGLGYENEIANRIGTTANGVTQARSKLQRRGLLDQASEVTAAGRAVLGAEYYDTASAASAAA